MKDIFFNKERNVIFKKNHKVAEYWLKLSVTSGYIKAQNRLSDYYKDKMQQNLYLYIS